MKDYLSKLAQLYGPSDSGDGKAVPADPQFFRAGAVSLPNVSALDASQQSGAGLGIDPSGAAPGYTGICPNCHGEGIYQSINMDVPCSCSLCESTGWVSRQVYNWWWWT